MQKILYHCDKCSKLVHEIHESAPSQFGESFRGVACSGSVHVTVGTFPAERDEQMVPVGRTDDERLTLCDECVDSMSARDLCEFSDQRRAIRRAKIERMISGFGIESAGLKDYVPATANISDEPLVEALEDEVAAEKRAYRRLHDILRAVARGEALTDWQAQYVENAAASQPFNEPPGDAPPTPHRFAKNRPH